MKKAIITGINGQDGSYLAELLLQKNYEVYGIVKRNDEDDIVLIDFGLTTDIYDTYYS